MVPTRFKCGQASGRLVDSAEPEMIAGAIEKLIANPSERAALGQAAKARAQELFSPEVIVPQYEALYREVCSGRGK